MLLLDGKSLSINLKEEIRKTVEARLLAGHRPPHLAAVLVGNDGASETYVASKVKACEEVGFESTLIRLPATIEESELLHLIEQLNQDVALDGFIVQLPLPEHINADLVTEAISPEKDVDGFHPVNLGLMIQNKDGYLPATPKGVLTMLERYQIETSGKHTVVIGRSLIVGAPMSVLMSRNAYPGNSTVTICHSKTQDLASVTRQADILIVALGKPGFVTADMVKPGAVVVDVGITRVKDESKKSGFRIAGDVDFESVKTVASALSPVPGGVGLMTIVSLLQNTLKAHQKHLNL